MEFEEYIRVVPPIIWHKQQKSQGIFDEIIQAAKDRNMTPRQLYTELGISKPDFYVRRGGSKRLTHDFLGNVSRAIDVSFQVISASHESWIIPKHIDRFSPFFKNSIPWQEEEGKNKLGNRIRVTRDSLGMSYADMAKQIDQGTLYRIENGTRMPRIPTIENISIAFQRKFHLIFPNYQLLINPIESSDDIVWHDHEDYYELIRRIRTARELQNIRPFQLHELTGISENTIRMLEKNRALKRFPDIENIGRILNALGVGMVARFEKAGFELVIRQIKEQLDYDD